MPLVRRTRATLRSAEFGFLGVVVYTRVHTPRRWGLPLSAGVLVLPTLSSRPLRTNCWIVGTASPCSVCGAFVVLLRPTSCYRLPAPGRPAPAFGCVARGLQDRAPAKLTGEVRRSSGLPARRAGATLARGTARVYPGTKYEATGALGGASKRPAVFPGRSDHATPSDHARWGMIGPECMITAEGAGQRS